MTHEDHPTGDGDTDTEVAETPIDPEIVASVAQDTGLSRDRIADGLVVLNASLLGEHSTYERDHEYVTHEGVRAYVVGREAWDDLANRHDLDSALADALGDVHTRHASALLDRAGADLAIEPDERGIVIGIDTAEDMR